MKMIFKSGPMFYFFFNARLFLRLLFRKADLLYANDLDTLLPNYLVSRMKSIPLIYDSHELFCEVPELQNTPFKKQIWEMLEGWIVPRLKHCITVNSSIAAIFEKKYSVKFNVVRNISEFDKNFIPKKREELGLPTDKEIIILQGAGLNVDRGAEELVAAMANVDALLLIIGGGDVWEKLKVQVQENGLGNKVWLISKIPRSELMHYTYNADLGISIDKPRNANYFNSLPNKIFDYIHAGVPVLVSRLPELERIVKDFGVGGFINNHEPAHIASCINEMLFSPQMSTWRENARRSAEILCWQNEKRMLRQTIEEATGLK
jgi:glycosyltransferase involved in cell wall biosynthesis